MTEDSERVIEQVRALYDVRDGVRKLPYSCGLDSSDRFRVNKALDAINIAAYLLDDLAERMARE